MHPQDSKIMISESIEITHTQAGFNTMRHKGGDSTSGMGGKLSIEIMISTRIDRTIGLHDHDIDSDRLQRDPPCYRAAAGRAAIIGAVAQGGWLGRTGAGH